MGTFPLDLTKTRLQVQGQQFEANFKSVKYRGMLHAMRVIATEEGFGALYFGIRPALLRQASYGTLKIGCYHMFKRLTVENPEDETLLVNVICGVSAGILSSAVCTPTDVLKVRMQAQGAGFSSSGMFHSFAIIFQEEGPRGLWRGVVPTAQRAAIVAGVELPVYDFTKKQLIQRKILSDNIYTHLAASFMAGLTGAIASNPVDVIRTRLMNQKNFRRSIDEIPEVMHFKYKNSFDCLVKTIQYEGPMALYKGFIPTFVRLTPWNIIFFVTYEQLKRLPI
ncbi:kidney mitochondrial carrier protein 1-like [Apostichopus japonicus]|uniref:kidney mitochondrial carrier protein 1-like n=1 Tax=Stichopus japonicus TaxID=307972 RepID=UPI003AB24C11